MRQIMNALAAVVAMAAIAVWVAGCQDKPIDPLKPKVAVVAMFYKVT